MKIALISCVKQKADKPQKARNLYISSLFVKSLEYAEKINVDKIYVLSAKYGLVPIDKVIEPYEKTLNNMKKMRELNGLTKCYQNCQKFLI